MEQDINSYQRFSLFENTIDGSINWYPNNYGELFSYLRPAWNGRVTNLFVDPYGAVGAPYWSSNSSYTMTYAYDAFPGYNTAAHAQRVSSASSRVDMVLGMLLQPSTEYTVMLTVLTNYNAASIGFNYRPSVASSTGAVSGGATSTVAGVPTSVRLYITTSASTITNNSGFVLLPGAGELTETVDVTAVMVVKGHYTGPFFPYSYTPRAPASRYPTDV